MSRTKKMLDRMATSGQPWNYSLTPCRDATPQLGPEFPAFIIRFWMEKVYDTKKSFLAWYAIAKCCGLWSHDPRTQYQSTFRFSIGGQQVIVIGSKSRRFFFSSGGAFRWSHRAASRSRFDEPWNLRHSTSGGLLLRQIWQPCQRPAAAGVPGRR